LFVISGGRSRSLRPPRIVAKRAFAAATAFSFWLRLFGVRYHGDAKNKNGIDDNIETRRNAENDDDDEEENK